MDATPTVKCRRCGSDIAEKYCGQCGEQKIIKRITLPGLLHDVFHLFTHLDKGFGFTVKELLLRPGHMQRDYVEGNRSRYQKPFSMFFICATIDALVRYWIYLYLLKVQHGGNEAEANYFHQYFVLTHMLMLPFYVLITWLVFYKAGYNYAETGVLMLYTIAFFFLVVTILFIPKLIWHDFGTAWIELSFIALYNAINFVNFYKKEKKWLVIVKSLIVVTSIFIIANSIEDLLADWLQPK